MNLMLHDALCERTNDLAGCQCGSRAYALDRYDDTTQPITTVTDQRPVLTSTTWMAAQLARARAAATA